MMDWVNRIVNDDCVVGLRSLPAGCVHTCVTSPPYFGLRDYGHDGQIGLEQTPDEYVAKMVDVFREVLRVLRDDGTLWLNLGDSYAGGGGGNYNKNGISQAGGQHITNVRNRREWLESAQIKPKDLIGIPWRVAFALQADGWYLRQDIIWHKPNPMPESVTDRCTKAHEYIFLLSKSARYYYDAEAIKMPVSESTIGRGPVDFGGKKGREYAPHQKDPNFRNGSEQWGMTFDYTKSCKTGVNRRSVWSVSTKPYSGAHFATYPPDLIEPCILAGSPEGGVVLDPFMGAGTTALVARKLNRNYVGLELNPEYVRIAEQRLHDELGVFA